MLTISPRAMTTSLDAMTRALLSPLDGGTLSIYGSVRPSDPDVAVQSAPLAVLRLSSPAITAQADGMTRINVEATPDVVATEDGIASWCRLSTPDGIGVLDGAVGAKGAVTASDVRPELILNSTRVQKDALVKVSDLTMTLRIRT